MPDAPADTGNAPEGRSDPGGPKLAGFPLWVWGVAAVGTFAVVWFLRSRSSAPAGSGTQAGMAAGTNPDFGISTTDPMTAAALLQQMQQLATRLAEGHGLTASISPAPSITPSLSSHDLGPPVTSYGGATGTSHTNGGTSIELVASSGLPDVIKPPVVVQDISNWWSTLATSVPEPSKITFLPPSVKSGLAQIAWPWNQPKPVTITQSPTPSANLAPFWAPDASGNI